MSRTIYSAYSKFTNVNGTADMLAKLYAFAIANGWTAQYYEVDKSWQYDGDGTYSWQANAGIVNLSLKSTGYGSQDHCYRWRVNPLNAQAEYLYQYGIKPGLNAVDENVSTDPLTVSNFNYTSNYTWVTFPSSTFPEMVVIGNAKYIAVHCRVSSLFTISFSFGTPELLPAEQSETQFNFHWPAGDRYCEMWYDMASPSDTEGDWHTPCQIWHRNYWIDSQSNVVGTIYSMLAYSDNCVASNHWPTRNELVGVNSFSGFRTLVAIPLFRKHPTTAVYRHVGHVPFYYIAWGGLTWGEVINRGTEEYLVFPVMFDNEVIGIAYRVA